LQAFAGVRGAGDVSASSAYGGQITDIDFEHFMIW
jgi:hypothetical protein